jgi:hypothetical protein
MVEKGFNSDISVRGFKYHIQTEDWGADYNYIMTRVFRNGEVVRSFKTTYKDIDYRGKGDDLQVLRLALREQHHQILDLLSADQV